MKHLPIKLPTPYHEASSLSSDCLMPYPTKISRLRSRQGKAFPRHTILTEYHHIIFLSIKEASRQQNVIYISTTASKSDSHRVPQVLDIQSYRDKDQINHQNVEIWTWWSVGFCVCFIWIHLDVIAMEKKGTVILERYELGRLLGQGTFAKVYHARNIKTGQSVAIKMIDKEKVLKVGLIEQIKREISVMRLVRHPNVVELYEVMASKTKIYFAMEYVKGGELFNKVAKGKLKEDVARKYFQQLIGSIDFCHSRGVYHRDLKPENLLLDENNDLKVSDFGLSALCDSCRQDGLLHTTCGTPAYVAPEIINKKGYDGAKADIWSCGVILFVLMAGYLPFHESNLMEMYRRISKADYKCPQWFSQDVRKLLVRILDPNPSTRITVAKLMENTWFRKGFKPIDICKLQPEKKVINLGDRQDALLSISDESSEKKPEPAYSMKLVTLNAFDIISLSSGFDLSGLFEKGKSNKAEARFTTTQPASAIVSKLEEIAEIERFSVKKKDGLVQMQGIKLGRKGKLAIEAEIFEVTPSFHMVEVKKSAGDTLEYHQFCNQDLRPSLKDIVWTWQGEQHQQQPQPV